MANLAVIAKNEGATPKRVRIDLRTPYAIGGEMQKVYRQVRSGAIQPDLGTKLIYMLTAISRQQTEGDLAQRIEALEKRNA